MFRQFKADFTAEQISTFTVDRAGGTWSSSYTERNAHSTVPVTVAPFSAP